MCNLKAPEKVDSGKFPGIPGLRLGLFTSTAGGMGSIPGWKLRSTCGNAKNRTKQKTMQSTILTGSKRKTTCSYQ